MEIRQPTRRIVLFVVVVAATLALAGLATAPAAAQETNETAPATGDELAQQQSEGWDVGQDVFFEEDGSVRLFRVTLEVSDQTYQEFEATAEDEGYESGAAWFANFYAQQNEEVTRLHDVATEQSTGGQTIVATYDVDITAAEDTTASIQNGQLTVETTNVPNPNQDDTIGTLVYRYHMPGEVVDSNADAVNGEVAAWALHRNPQSTLRVTSETTATSGPNGDDSDQQQQSDGFDLQFNVTISSDATVSGASVSLDVSDATYQQFQALADQRGFETGAEAFADQIVTSEEAYVDYANPRDIDSEKGTRMVFDVEMNASATENLTVTREDGEVVVSGVELSNDPAQDQSVATATYRFEMPGEITETNAIETQGNTAIYRLHEEYVSEIQIRASVSESSSDGESDGEDEDDDGGDGASGPGFGVAVTLLAALVAALLLARRP